MPYVQVKEWEMRIGCNFVFIFQSTHRPINRTLQMPGVWAWPLFNHWLITKPCRPRLEPLGFQVKKKINTRNNKLSKEDISGRIGEGDWFHSLSPDKFLRTKPTTPRKIKLNPEIAKFYRIRPVIKQKLLEMPQTWKVRLVLRKKSNEWKLALSGLSVRFCRQSLQGSYGLKIILKIMFKELQKNM